MLKIIFFPTDSNSVMYLDRNLRLVQNDVEINTIQVLLTAEQVVNFSKKKKQNKNAFQ